MVANIRSGSSPSGALYYNKEKVDKDEAEVLLWQKMLEPFDKHGRLDIDACMESFRPYLEANRRTTSTVFHASLNSSPEDKLTDEQLREITQEYMERMGYGNLYREAIHYQGLRHQPETPRQLQRTERSGSFDVTCDYIARSSIRGRI